MALPRPAPFESATHLADAVKLVTPAAQHRELPVDLAAYLSDASELRLGGIWHRGMQVRSLVLMHASHAEHLESARNLARRGFQPASISVAPHTAVGELHIVSVWRHPLRNEAIRNRVASSKCNLAVALLKLKQMGSVLEFLRDADNDLASQYFLHRVVDAQVDANILFALLEHPLNEQSQRFLLLALAQFALDAIPDELRQALPPRLNSLYQRDERPAVRSAVEWLAKHLSIELEVRRNAGAGDARDSSYTNAVG
jgi:hypothetical protein